MLNFLNFMKKNLPRLLACLLLLAMLMGQVPASNVLAAGEQLILTKTIEGGVTTAQVGDIIRYRIRFECSSLTGPCGQMEITDVLDPGLIYQPPPTSSVPAGFSISYNAGTRTITITKDDNNLLDGSQYDAVIAVQVDYDLRPLPDVIQNTVNGRIDPPDPASWINAIPAPAPDITVGTVTPSWGMTKSLLRPSINPTVNTDVTYQIQLCPTAPPPGQGNVPLRNITIIDTLPAGATFVSASNGGTELVGTVTWPVFAGPIYPPNCLTRTVTIRYNSPPFIVGNSVTNTANANGSYTDSSGGIIGPVGVATDPINHPIDPIAETPTYGKSDTGDPVGFTGTGRFILNLNTNGTNFPPNELILIDNLPPQLQVTAVTSGAWSATFDYVRAYIEYSTNNGNSYTAFPGQPISYNTNATYVAPAANITNVRWRFEYDPDGVAPFTYTQAGLPYTWAFTTSPEIRITPRAVATTSDAPPVLMPAAVAGTTYTNCLFVSRRNSSNVVVTDPCANETMTVQGSFVSLRTSKNETPGTSWDDLSDPTINTFVADGTILPGDTLKYTLTVEVTERSSAPLIDPTILDTLPPTADFVFVRNGIAQLDGVDLVTQPTFSQPAANQLKWEFPGLTINPLPLGSRFLTVEFFARVPRGQAPGTYTNNMYTVTDSVDVLCENGTQVQDSANGDVDGDGDSTDPACQIPDDYVVERSAALRGEKWIRSTDAANIQVVDATTFLPSGVCPDGGTTGLAGGGTNPFTRFPCISQAFPEGALSPNQLVPPPASTTLDDFEYSVRIFNDGNISMLNYVLYDILPYVGDTGSGGTLSGTARASEFRPIMRGPVEFLSGPAGLSIADFTIEYNNTSNPCRPEVFNQPTGASVPGSCNNTWTTTWSASALSYRIRLNAGSSIAPASTSLEVRFGVPMYIPLDAAPVGFDPNDALSHEIAWNSFSHVGSYDKDPSPSVDIQDLLASEPRKVGITVPERMSVGNRVWRDADNSGTINAPDDINPGIVGVTVNLYRDADNNGIPDGAAIATTTTDTGGYYLFSNIPYDLATPGNNRYIIGIPASNFTAGQPLESLRSSTGIPPSTTYTNPPTNVVDSADDGIDPASAGLEVLSTQFILQPTTEPTSEADLSANDRDGLPDQRRGVNGERNNNSDLTIDFGFFGGTDIPFSIGNHVWYDSGQTAPGVFNFAQRNDGYRQSTEPPVVGVLVRLYRDGNANGNPEPAEMIRTDTTDTNGFYLFDNLDPGLYYVEIPVSQFATGQPLAGWYSSQPTGSENVGVPGNTNTPNMDSDDNGIDTDTPETDGVFSGVVVLTRGVPETIGETHLSGEADPGAPANTGYNPTGWDGPGSLGRFGETDASSNLTIDFGFIPPMSLGNRVWIDEGAGTTPFRAGFNNGIQDGTEAGVNGVRVELWRDTNGTPGLQAGDTFLRFTTTDATGYYLFDRMQPGTDYLVHIPASNFTGAGALVTYLSSTDATPPVDDATDMNDNGIDSATPATTGITSPQITMAYNTEPLTFANETDINNSGTYGPQNRGLFGQGDGDSNLTIDFGFVRPPRSIGNRLWIDTNNNGQVDGGEPPVPTGTRVSLYLDVNADNQPDDLNQPGDRTDDWIAFDTTDANGYYLFDNLPPNIYIVGVDRANFAPAGLLDGYNSCTGNVDNATNNTDDRDNGVDRLLRADPVASPHGILSTRINLTTTPVNAPTGEVGSGDTSSALGFNPTAGDGPQSRGRFGESDANSDLTIDFGFFIPMSLGNRVFLDDGNGGGTYNNGIMDGGELPIANVRIELYRDADANGVPDASGLVGFDVTDTGGYYLFDDLPEGSYVVLIPSSNFTGAGPLVGRNSSTPTGTENVGVPLNPYTPNTDRDDNGINNGSPITLPAATPGILSGTIALVHNVEPTGEAELSGQANPGSPANLAFSPTGWDGTTPGSRGRWDEIDANSNLTIDFGFIPVFSLGNRVWFDTDNSNTINGSEVGVDNVRVQLFASNGTTEILVGPDGILNTADDAAGGMLTAGGGYYRFNNLPAGDYIVKLPASNFGVGQPLRSYWSSGTTINGVGTISETTAALANSDTDSDDNGTLTSGDVISSVVTLGPTITSEPAGEADLSGGQGQPDQQANMTVDFGFYRVEIGNLVYLDVNGNGNYDGAPDTTITGATVRLYAANGTTEINVGADGILGTADDAAGGMVTSGAGIYRFSGLPAGDYVVKTVSPTGLTSTIDTFSNTDTIDPDVNVDNNDNGVGQGFGTVSANTLTMIAGEVAANITINNANGTTTDNTVDFGYIGMVAIGNRVWFDNGAGGGIFNNGILDGSETGVANVRVELYTSTGTLVTFTTTDASGYYQFDQLYPAAYYVMIPATEFQSGKPLETYYSTVDNGANETSDENVDENGIDNAAPATNGIRSIDYVLTPGTEPTGEGQSNYTGVLADNSVNFTTDFGFVQKYSIGNRIWFDTDNSSTINGAEVGVDGITVNLYAASDLTTILFTNTTSNGGYYLFDDLYPGDYVVSVAASNFSGAGVLTGYWSSGTSRLDTGALSEVTASLANNNTDSDDNGTLQSAGVLNGAVISSTVTLGPSGNTEPTLESDLEAVVGQGNQADARANMTVDFGFYTQTLGNLVWSDTDKDGGKGVTESGIDGVTVELWSADGSTLLATTTTAGGGLYSFPGLAQGNYTVHVSSPVGTASSVDTFASADTSNPTTNTDNNDNGVGTGGGTVVSNPVTLTPGAAQTSNTVNNSTGSTINPTIDFGFNPVFSLGNRVWFDTDNSSTTNGTEVGINGVTVNLYSASDLTTILSSQTTVNGGYYLFNNLVAGDYVVSIAASNFSGVLSGYWSSATSRTAAGVITETTAATANSDTDLDDNGTLQTSGTLNGAVTSSVVTLGSAITSEPASESDLDGGNQGQPDTQANMTVDFGFYTMRLGDVVWIDLDNNGLLDGAEVGISGVTVQLLSADGSTVLATTTTNVSGIYTFNALPTGDYILRLPASNFNPGGILRDYRSSTGGGTYEPAPDADTNTANSDDNGSETNGLLGLGGYIQTLPLTLIPAGEESFNNATGLTTEFRVDLGVYNGPQIDLSVTKTDNQAFYIAGGTLNYVVTITNNGPADANGMTINDALPAQIASWAWACAPSTPAAYNCTDAPSNSAAFSDSLDLPQLASVTYNVTAQVAPTATGDLTNSVTITPPTGLTDLTPPDNTANDTDEPASLTVTKDDSVTIVAPDFTTTYTITVNNTGVADLTGIVLVDTIPAGMSFVSASGGGTSASGKVTWPAFDLLSSASTSFTVQLKVADLASLGSITSFANVVDVEDDGSKTGGTPITSQGTDTDQLASSNVKALTNTNQPDSTSPNVLIGEILTYSIRIDIPVGTINNLKAVDILEHGLAFVGCDATTPISSGSLVLAQNPCTTASALSVENEPVTDTNPASEDAGRHITFTFGQVQNTSGAVQSLIVNYQVVVLDIAANNNGVTGINNAVTWSWEGGSLSGAATDVNIIEPDLDIFKSVDPNVTALGSIVSFSIDIEHTSASAAPAYDVLVTDTIPTGLALVPASVSVTGTSGLPAPTVTTTPNTIDVLWTSFPLGESATITFQAAFIGPSPVINTAFVQWSSIQIDPQPILQPQSGYNNYSTERRYDPPSQTVNDYRKGSAATITTPVLPQTGFAPGVISVLPAQPHNLTYANLGELWMEIPALKLKTTIAGVPSTTNGWDLTWLANQSGWLEGTAFPTHAGNSAVTAHAYLADGTPGPFAKLEQLRYGDQIIIHFGGQRYIFEVRQNKLVKPNDLSILKHEDYSWLTLITCKSYNESTNSYLYRTAVRAVLVKVETDK